MKVIPVAIKNLFLRPSYWWEARPPIEAKGLVFVEGQASKSIGREKIAIDASLKALGVTEKELMLNRYKRTSNEYRLKKAIQGVRYQDGVRRRDPRLVGAPSLWT